MKNKIPKHEASNNCIFCGCSNPLGEFPKILSREEMCVVIKKHNLLLKEIASDLGVTVSGIARLLYKPVPQSKLMTKLNSYLHSRFMAAQNIQSTTKTQSETAGK